MIKVDTSHAIIDIDYASYADQIKKINQSIDQKTGEGNDFLGWTNYPENYDKEEFERIIKAGEFIQKNCEALVVCGIGGSYLGARAAIEAINGLLPTNKVKILFFGNTFDPDYSSQILGFLKGKKFAINVISKSGTTTETSVGFRLVKELLEEQVGKKEASKYIFATTDKARGALIELAKKYGYERFVLPDDIGGRYSVFTAVGLLPMAAAGIDIRAFMEGALAGQKEYDTDTLNEAYKYAVARRALYVSGKSAEMFVTYKLQLVQLTEWWKQLYGESEGKDGKGLLPDSATFTTDLHSLGQFVQEGTKLLFETILNVEEPAKDIKVPHDDDNLDGLNYLEGKGLDYVNKKAFEGTLDAHENTGKVPNIVISISKMDAYNLGQLMYFFMRACAMSAYLNGVNPFNQPGVEVYKKNMFHLLGKPGF